MGENELRKNYIFKCGIKAWQEECSYSQDKQLVKLLETVDISEIKDFSDMKVSDIVSKIFDNDLIPKLFDIILIHEMKDATPDWTQLKRSEVVEVIEDFFQLSPTLKKWFGTGKLKLDSLLDSSVKTVN